VADEEQEPAPTGLPDLGALTGTDSPLAGLFEQAQQMAAAQAQAAEQEVEGVAGGGAVRIRATGAGHVVEVTIAPEAVDPNDVSMLEDLVLAALHDLNARRAEIQREALGDLGGLLGGDPAGGE
jgi:DNA-binding YbaB/EbfC family protein